MAGIVPTKSNLMAAQKSLKLAKLGYELMDRKKNILIKELLSLAADAKTIRADTDKAFSEAYESLRHAEMTLGRCGTFAMSVPIDDAWNCRISGTRSKNPTHTSALTAPMPTSTRLIGALTKPKHLP